jgi:hypothetical protein
VSLILIGFLVSAAAVAGESKAIEDASIEFRRALSPGGELPREISLIEALVHWAVGR